MGIPRSSRDDLKDPTCSGAIPQVPNTHDGV